MEKLNHRIKDYDIKEMIGVGGFGEVYRAYQQSLNREVAIKVISPTIAQQPDFIRHFEAEAQRIAHLEHMNIVPLYDYWRDPNGAYLIMRYLRAGNLGSSLNKRHYELRVAGGVLSQIASALHVAHRNYIIHQNIKPTNILMDNDGNAYLSDFSIFNRQNRLDGKESTHAASYVAPEQVRGEAITPQTDIYSLGIVLYEMLAGAYPFTLMNADEPLHNHDNEPLPYIMNLPSHIADAVNEVIQRACAKNPKHRFENVKHFATTFLDTAKLTHPANTVNLAELLTPREQEILQLMIDGLSNRDIAEQLFISVSTVKATQSHMYSKLRIKNRVQAIARGRELDFVIDSPKLISQQPAPTMPTISELSELKNPFKGLKAFQTADSHEFFGRDSATQKLIERLVETDQWHRFLAVIGPSGSGKSSLVRAGLIPAIWRGEIRGSERWFVVEMIPGSRPLDELELALQRISRSSP